ncbi:peroxiredoxin family protein [Paraliobacillus sediminis]|uniref:peroxiredoxin family protein n=1 Tax=Paraliobacillus sediminis TaxID=1885916 RepID=UPI001F0842E1|nr:TlpA disulfide reductase family protein [Paraliobacillus sediminis]
MRMMSLILVGMFGWAVYDFIDNNEAEVEIIQLTEKQEDQVQQTSEGLEIGDAAPNFRLKTSTGGNIELTAYRGQRVVLNFWATWCPPCRVEMPDMEKLYSEKNVQVLAVNLTQSEAKIEDVTDFVTANKLTFPILLDEQLEVATKYEVRPIPITYMIDSNGIIQHKSLGALSYQQMVQTLDAIE